MISRFALCCSLILLPGFLGACVAVSTDDREEELVAREVGNTGGVNYGEFGLPDAYENGSPHPYYGSENEWGRRMFSERASNLYYKRRGQRQMLAITDGEPANALALVNARLSEDPRDLESLFLKTIALTQLGEIDSALSVMQEALDAGLPFARYLAGPRNLLAPLTNTAQFQTIAANRSVVVVHGPMLGAVTDSSARFWIRSAHAVPFEVHVSDGDSVYVASGSTAADDDFTGVAIANGLQQNTEYSYEVRVGGEAVTDEFRFVTAPRPGTAGNFQVGFGGCAGYTPANERVWDTIASHTPRAFLFLGDNVYIDVPEAPGPVHEYSYYRRQSRPEFRRLVGESPAYAIWDDHDAGFDDIWFGPYVDKPAWKQPMVNSFRQNWNNPSYGSDSSPGTWFRFSIGDVDFFMLDGRTYRTNPFIDGRSMLGPEQMAWLQDALVESTATFKVIASPVAWADGAKPGSIDTWSGFPEEREALFSLVERENIPGVVLLSSDRHRSEAWKIDRDSGYPFYELLSGQLTNIHTHPKEDGALFSYNAKDSFGLLSFDTDRDDPQLTYQIYSIDNELVNTLVIRRSELTSQ